MSLLAIRMHRIKRLKPSQWNVLKRVRLEALRDTPDAFGTTYEEESQYNEEEWRKRLQREDCITYVAFIEDSPIGLVVGAPYDERAGLFAMWVNSKYRGKGLGHEVMNILPSCLMWQIIIHQHWRYISARDLHQLE